jgi:hypothetical protein
MVVWSRRYSRTNTLIDEQAVISALSVRILISHVIFHVLFPSGHDPYKCLSLRDLRKVVGDEFFEPDILFLLRRLSLYSDGIIDSWVCLAVEDPGYDDAFIPLILTSTSSGFPCPEYFTRLLYLTGRFSAFELDPFDDRSQVRCNVVATCIKSLGLDVTEIIMKTAHDLFSSYQSRQLIELFACRFSPTRKVYTLHQLRENYNKLPGPLGFSEDDLVGLSGLYEFTNSVFHPYMGEFLERVDEHILLLPGYMRLSQASIDEMLSRLGVLSRFRVEIKWDSVPPTSSIDVQDPGPLEYCISTTKIPPAEKIMHGKFEYHQ